MNNDKVQKFETTVDTLLYMELQRLSAVTGKSKDQLLQEAILLLSKHYRQKLNDLHRKKPRASR